MQVGNLSGECLQVAGCSECTEGRKVLRIWALEVSVHRLQTPGKWSADTLGQADAAADHYRSFLQHGMRQSEKATAEQQYLKYLKVRPQMLCIMGSDILEIACVHVSALYHSSSHE
jgi:hypothetical protein